MQSNVFSPQNARNWEPKRRDFLKVIGSGSVSLTFGGIAGCGGGEDGGEGGRETAQGLHSQSYDLALDEKYWQQTSGLFEHRSNVVQFDTDGGMVRPAIAVNRLRASRQQAVAAEGYTIFSEQRELLAASLGVQKSTLALTATATDAMRRVLFGIQWNAGDVIITSNQEHPNTVFYLSLLESVYQIKCVYIDTHSIISREGDSYVQEFSRQIESLIVDGQKIRALLWSSPSYQTGLNLPIDQMSTLAKRHQLISICDGAHLIGMAHFDFNALDIDFLCGSGHKWQCGVNAVGLLFLGARVTSGAIPLATSLYDMIEQNYKSMDLGGGSQSAIADRLSVAHSSREGLFDALIEACKFWGVIGRPKIQTQIYALNAYLRGQMSQHWKGDSLEFTVNDPKYVSGMTTLNPFQNGADIELKAKSESFVSNLRDKYGFQVKRVELKRPNGRSAYPIRVSTPIWINTRDIDRLVEAMNQLSLEMA